MANSAQSSKGTNGKSSSVSPEQALILRALGDHVMRKKTSQEAIPADLDWNEVATLARRLCVSQIVYHQCRHFEGKPLEALDKVNLVSLFYRMQREELLGEVNAAFSNAGIPYIIVKGTEIAQCYPVPELRFMADSDILVHESDKQRAHEALVAAGFTCRNHGSDTEWEYSRDRITFELHHRLLYDLPVNFPELKRYCDEAWEHSSETGNGTRRTLDWDFHLTYLFLHLRKDLLNGSVDVRRFLDLAALSRSENVDWNKTGLALDSIGMLDFGMVCMGLCSRWFGIESPWGDVELADAFVSAITEAILLLKPLGAVDQDYAQTALFNQVRERNEGPIDKAASLMRTAFPSYDSMRTVPYYSFLNGKPYLLPAAWVYRLWYIGCKEGALESVANLEETKKKFHERESRLKQWGL